MSTMKQGETSWRRGVPVLLLVAVVGLVVEGCGQPAVSGSLNEATVTGHVTIKGKPAGAGGTVTFNPANASRKDVTPRETKIDPDGRYSITTLVGHNTATVRIPNPPRGADLRRAGKGIDVLEGTNTLDLDVPAMPVPLAKTPSPRKKSPVIEER